MKPKAQLAAARVRALGRRVQALAAAAILGLAAVAPAHAYQLGDFLKRAASALPQQPATPPAPAAAPAPRPATTAPAGPMAMQAGSTALPPLHRLGTDAVAVIEAATPNAPVRQMDYVFAKQTITLAPKASITLSYLSGCMSEVILGGVVTVAPTGSRVSGGKLTTHATPGCRAANPVILASASEAGATVNRITPFTGFNWDERALKGGPPVFKWDKALSAVTVRVKDMDKAGEPVIWQAPVVHEWIAYPPAGPALAPGEPYKVEVLNGDKVVASALFSIDPALDEADTLANRVVPLTAS